MSLCGSPDVSFPSSETVHTENVLAQSSPSQEGSLRQSKVTETPIVLIVKDADAGRPVNEIWRNGISSMTYDTWNATYGGLEASGVTRLKELAHENGCLKWMDADLSLENAALKEVIAQKL